MPYMASDSRRRMAHETALSEPLASPWMDTADWVGAGIGTLAILLSAYTYLRGRALDKEQKRIEAAQEKQQRRIEYLQGSKEQVAHQAMSVADSGFQEGEEGRQILRSMLLAAIFENSGRARALVISALHARYDESSSLIDAEIQRVENDLAVFAKFGVDVDDSGQKVKDFDVSKGQERIDALRRVLEPGGAGKASGPTDA